MNKKENRKRCSLCKKKIHSVELGGTPIYYYKTKKMICDDCYSK